MRFSSIIWLSAAIAMQADTVGASNLEPAPQNQIEEVVVTGSRLTQTSQTKVRTLDADAIERSGAASVTDLLSRLPGVSTYEAGGAGGESEVFLRGADANFTTVLIDGIPAQDVSDIRGGAVDLSSVNPLEVERVEMVQGPYTALYGSGGLAGVIALSTLPQGDAQSPSGQITMGGGNDGFWRAGVKLNGPLAAGHGGVVLSHTDFGEPTTGAARELTALSGGYRQSFAADSEVRFSLRTHDLQRSGFPITSGGPRFAVSRALETSDVNQLATGLALRHPWRQGVLRASLSYFEREEDLSSPAIAAGVFQGVPATERATEFDRLLVSVHSSFDLRSNLNLSIGTEYASQEGSNEGVLDFGFFAAPTDFDLQRETYGVFSEAAWEVSPSWTLHAALRHDDHSDVGGQFASRVGLVYAPRQSTWNLGVNYGRGLKAPSFYALGDPLVGNPQLAEEENSGWEVSWYWQPSDRLSLNVMAYDYAYDGLIDFDFATFALINRGEIESSGVQIEVRGAITPSLGWRLSGDVGDFDGDGPLLHRSERIAQLALEWAPLPDLQVMFSNRYVGTRASSSIASGTATLAAYTRSDLVVSREFAGRLVIRLAVENLFDVPYAPVVGFRSGGTQFRLGLSRKF